MDEELNSSDPAIRSGKNFSRRTISILPRPLRGLSGRTKRSPTTGSSTTRGERSPIARLGGQSPKRISPRRRSCLATALRGLAQIEAYREAVRTWNRLVEDPRTPRSPPTNTMSPSASRAVRRPEGLARRAVGLSRGDENCGSELRQRSRRTRARQSRESREGLSRGGKAADPALAETPH